MNKASIKFIHSLHLRKNRKAEGLFIAEGRKVVEELLKSSIEVKEIYVTDELRSLFRRIGGLTVVSDAEMRKMSALTTPQGILAVCAIPHQDPNQPDLKTELVLALDGISDPGNLGTIIRIAHWFGIRHIYCSHGCTDAFSPKVVQASMGSIKGVNMHYENLQGFLSMAADDIPVYGAMLKGISVYTEKLKPNGILVIGSESNGISKEIIDFVKNPLSIPSFNSPGGGPESLNAAVATAIICSEFRRGTLS